MPQAKYDFAQHRLLHRFGCFLDGEPLDVALLSFWPLPTLTQHFQWEDAHFADHDAPGPEALFVKK